VRRQRARGPPSPGPQLHCEEGGCPGGLLAHRLPGRSAAARLAAMLGGEEDAELDFGLRGGRMFWEGSQLRAPGQF